MVPHVGVMTASLQPLVLFPVVAVANRSTREMVAGDTASAWACIKKYMSERFMTLGVLVGLKCGIIP